MIRRPISLTVTVVAAALLSGCAMSGRHEALEVRLREHESTIRDLRSQIHDAEQTIAELDEELVIERNHLSGNTDSESPAEAFQTSGVTQVAFTPEIHAAWGSVASIGIYRLTSGLSQDDGQPHKNLNVVVQSLDSDGELVKTAGALTVTASIVDNDGTTQQIAHQLYSITECRRLWTRTFVAPGFHINIPLEAASEMPLSNGDKLLVTATLNLGHNRRFSTSELLDISL
ncbi:MAG: hypothetical protein P8J37_03885 [Fuerstiella sp.]|nr:hypothetical protein [Fuerstiella sp.]